MIDEIETNKLSDPKNHSILLPFQYLNGNSNQSPVHKLGLILIVGMILSPLAFILFR